MHFIPRSNDRDQVLEFLDSLARRNSHLNASTKVCERQLKLGEVLARSVNPSGNENLNGVRSLLLTNIFLAEMKNQGLIKNFYHCDQPLLNQINDEKFMDNKTAKFLDNCGVDIFVELNDGKYVPVQIKSSSALKSRVSIKVSRDDFGALAAHYSDKEFKTRLSSDGEENTLYIKRKIPTFTTDLRVKDSWGDLFDRFTTFIKQISQTNQALTLTTDLNNKPCFELVKELVDNNYIHIFSEDEYKAEPLGQAHISTSCDNTAAQLCKSNSPRHNIEPLARHDEEIYNSRLDTLDDPVKLRSFLSNRMLLWSRGFAESARTELDKTLKKFFAKYIVKSASVSKADQSLWFRMLTSKNKLGPAMLRQVKGVELANPNSGYTEKNFIQLKQDIIIALLKDNFEQVKSIPEKRLRQRFNTQDYSSIWNPHNFSIPSLVQVFEELELNNLDLGKVDKARANIFIRSFTNMRDLLKGLMGFK
jgi:hypothetical protein